MQGVILWKFGDEVGVSYVYSTLKFLPYPYAQHTFKYDEDGNIAQEPLFWIEEKTFRREDGYSTYTVEFTSSSGKITEY
jgi:hypothetical protein